MKLYAICSSSAGQYNQLDYHIMALFVGKKPTDIILVGGSLWESKIEHADENSALRWWIEQSYVSVQQYFKQIDVMRL